MTPTPEPDFSSCIPIVNKKNEFESKWNLIFSKTSETAWISFNPQLGLHVYPCYACRDMFVSKNTFQDHINRRAIIIKYHCRECNQAFHFYNRCSFLLHARNHFSLTEGKVDLGNIEVYRLPFGMMGFLPHPGINILFGEQEDTVDDNCFINAQFYCSDPSEKGKQVITLKPTDLLFCGTGDNSGMTQLTLKQISRNIPRCQFVTVDCQKNLKRNFLGVEHFTAVKEEITEDVDDPQPCPLPSPAENIIQMPVISKIESLNTDNLTYSKCAECKATHKCSMKLHFLGKNVPIDDALKCSFCKFVSPTKCSFSAHERIHSNIAPFICPECGKKFESRQYLMKHLDEVCFHLAKQMRIRCPGKKCGKLFASQTTFTAHFAQHIQAWQQCSLCKECFQNVIDFSEHAKSHSSFCSANKVFKCLGCKFDGCIIYEDNIKHHLHYHSSDRSKYMYVFVCKFCRNYLRSTATYAAHLLKCQKMPRMMNDVNSYTIDLCVRCHSRIIYYDNENTVSCSKCRHSNSLLSNQNENSSTNSNIQPKKHDSIASKVKICLLCKENFPSGEKDHLSRCIYGNPRVVIKKLEHEIPGEANFETSENGSSGGNDVNDTSPGSVSRNTFSRSTIANVEETDTECSTKSSTKGVSPNTQEALKRKRKRAPFVFRTKKLIVGGSPEKVIDLQADEAKPFDGTYYCKMCDFQESERDEFHFHIISHRDISTDYQCMECGECFVVKPSLIKHLKHYHKIEDTNSYLESNNCYDKNAVEKLKEIMKLAPGESREPVKENQCRVCLQEFPDEQELKIHFRVHGMAFLMKNTRDGA